MLLGIKEAYLQVVGQLGKLCWAWLLIGQSQKSEPSGARLSRACCPWRSRVLLSQSNQKLYASILFQKKAIGHVTWSNDLAQQILLRLAQQSLPNWSTNYKSAFFSYPIHPFYHLCLRSCNDWTSQLWFTAVSFILIIWYGLILLTIS